MKRKKYLKDYIQENVKIREYIGYGTMLGIVAFIIWLLYKWLV